MATQLTQATVNRDSMLLSDAQGKLVLVTVEEVHALTVVVEPLEDDGDTDDIGYIEGRYGSDDQFDLLAPLFFALM